MICIYIHLDVWFPNPICMSHCIHIHTSLPKVLPRHGRFSTAVKLIFYINHPKWLILVFHNAMWKTSRGYISLRGSMKAHSLFPKYKIVKNIFIELCLVFKI